MVRVQIPVIIKYIIKQRILADCWKKHKVLGPIPVEVHVLDQLRRIPYASLLPPHAGQGPPPITGHPNLCSLLDFWEDEETYYLCMPVFGGGQDLFDRVDECPSGLPVNDIANILAQVSAGVAFLHVNGIVHRDIKDENVILDGVGNAALIDFGSAAYVKEGQLFDTFSGTLECVFLSLPFSWLSADVQMSAALPHRRYCTASATMRGRQTCGPSGCLPMSSSAVNVLFGTRVMLFKVLFSFPMSYISASPGSSPLSPSLLQASEHTPEPQALYKKSCQKIRDLSRS